MRKIIVRKIQLVSLLMLFVMSISSNALASNIESEFEPPCWFEGTCDDW